MPSKSNSESALRVFYMAHKFFNEFGVHWLPVDSYEIINQHPNWNLKYVHQLAYEIGKSEQYVLDHVMRSHDGLSLYDVAKNQYDIIINADDSIPQTRMRWTIVHEIGHIYLGHLSNNKVTSITEEKLSKEMYNQLEFEADVFAGEVLASKWLMRYLDIMDEKDITLICGISDDAARSRYKKATEDYSFIPANVVFTLHNFEAYTKEITVCRPLSWFELGKFIKINASKIKFSKPKPPFMRKAGECPYCGNHYTASPDTNFCSACGTPLKTGMKVTDAPCKHVGHKDAAFCECCGNKVFRTRQGFCFEECEI